MPQNCTVWLCSSICPFFSMSFRSYMSHIQHFPKRLLFRCFWFGKCFFSFHFLFSIFYFHFLETIFISQTMTTVQVDHIHVTCYQEKIEIVKWWPYKCNLKFTKWRQRYHWKYLQNDIYTKECEKELKHFSTKKDRDYFEAIAWEYLNHQKN